MKKILVDTSIWIEYFKGNKQVVDLIHDKTSYSIYIAGPIITELIQGLKTASEKGIFTDVLGGLPSLPVTDQDWIDAGIMGATLREKGITVPLPDLLIYTLALNNSCLLYSKDKHFKMINDATKNKVKIKM